MKPRAKKTILVVAIPTIILFCLAGNQLRLAKNYQKLESELLDVRAFSESTNGRKNSTDRNAASPPTSARELTAIPKGTAEVAALRKQIKQVEEELGALRNTIAQVEQGRLQNQISSLSGIPENLVFRSGVTLPSTGRSWGQEQVVGEPDTRQLGDIPTAWAPKNQNGGEEWLQVEFDEAVALSEINVHESHNPGAISKVAVVMPDGSEKTIWEGQFEEEQATGIVERAFQVNDSITANSVKIYMDTTRVPGWNEIDAVELVGSDDSRQWASSARASSTYAE